MPEDAASGEHAARLLDGARRVHFVGIGGAGMCGLAEVLLRSGYAVSGSDVADSAVVRRLATLGAVVRHGHHAAAVQDAELVVASTAIDADNVELARARELGVPVLPRGALLAALMRGRFGIAVAGSHGKTTTAGLIASIFVAGGMDPTCVIGGELTADGGNAWHGRGGHLIAEADESDASFLLLRPTVAVVTNIDRDHLDTYGQQFARLRSAFAEFRANLPEDGTLVACADDAGSAALAQNGRASVLTYGFASDADVRAVDVDAGGAPWRFTVQRRDAEDLRVASPLPGCRNVQNALAAIAVATAVALPDEAVAAGLAGFPGVARRFSTAQCRIAGKRFTLLDDYGHHPTELAHVVDTARRLWPGRRLLMAFQPHRYTRTRDLQAGFVSQLSRVDELILADVYAASEAPIPGADGRALAAAIERHGALAPRFAATPERALELLLETLRDDDIVAVQGAGDIDRAATALRSESARQAAQAGELR